MDTPRARTVLSLIVLICLASPASAQRDLHWSRIDVDASLAADGTLRVSEMQTMVFTGEWNGGERVFNVRPRQRLEFIELARAEGDAWRPLIEDSSIDGRDEYAWFDDKTLRWRSREPGDPPFASTAIRYLLRYELSNILVRDGNDYVLDHDFLFPDRVGNVDAFQLRLQLDPAWQPKSEIRERYTAEQVVPGRGFVLTIPMRHSGAVVPAVWDTSRPPELLAMIAGLIGVTVFLVLWIFAREHAHGRFAPLATNVDEAWLREHVLKYPAEVVGAAWDEDVGSAEVMSLIARLVGEGKLESEVGSRGEMTLRLKVDRGDFSGHERTLIQGLFFNGRETTSTGAVKQHYQAQGFDPAKEIKRELEQEVERVIPTGRVPRRFRFLGMVCFFLGIALLLFDYVMENSSPPRALSIGAAALVLVAFGWSFGTAFRHSIHFGRKGGAASLIPALASVAAVAWFLWAYAGTGEIEISTAFAGAIVALALAVVITTVNTMRSQRQPVSTAFRRKLGAAREFFDTELAKDRPALRDEWFPWIVAFGLGPRVDAWTTRQRPSESDSSSYSRSTSPSTSGASSSDSSAPQFSGFSGGRAGGAGGGAGWTTAMSGLAAGVAAPSASDSGGGGSSGGSSSSSSSSSGGGGGGGW